MRKAIYAGSEDEARALFARARAIHLATTDESGAPILRTVHAVLSRGRDGAAAIAFHGAPAGEKMRGLGRRAVASVEEIVASVPSWFLDPERACPATTYFLSAQAHGVLEEIVDAERKAEVLAELMAKHQPEGGHVPISPAHPLYRKAIAGLLVAELRVERLSCKTKLGQNRTPSDRARVVEGLWRRGEPEDVRAVALLLDRFPEVRPPASLRAPEGSGLRLACALEGTELDEASALLEGAYWLEGVSRGAVRAALERSTARVGVRDRQGRLVAFARAVSDGKVAWVYDVIVADAHRASGVGTALLRMLLDHPAVRGARHVRLTTRDAMRFYRRLGFVDLAEAPRRPWPTVEMIRSERPAERGAREAGADDREQARLG